MSKFSRNKLKYSVNESFFNNWSSNMAYVLGFTYADGNLYKTTLSWDVQLKDKNILEKINTALESNYPISIQRNSSYRLRITNQMLINGAIKLGIFPKKKFRNCLPKIPSKFLKDFVRGFIDGDGWLILRKGRDEFDIGFCGGNKLFLEEINKILCSEVGVTLNPIRKRVKVTPKKASSTTYMVEYFSSNAMKIAEFLYGNLKNDDLYLDRKFTLYKQAKELYDYLGSGTKVVRVVQKKFGVPIRELLMDLHSEKHLDGVKISHYLGVHSSSIYRWLEQAGIRYPVKRISYG